MTPTPLTDGRSSEPDAGHTPSRAAGDLPDATPFVLPCTDGDIAGVDHGGSGPLVLLLHDRLENAARWAAVGPALAPFCRPVALDAPGHGASPLGRYHTADRWRRLGEAVDLLGLGRPLVVAQGLGGWDATAAAAAGRLDPTGLILLDAVLPGSAEETSAYLDQFDSDEIVAGLVERFGLGRHAHTLGEVDALVDELVAAASADWLLREADLRVLRAELRRAFAPSEGGWTRHPAPDVARLSFQAPDDPAAMPSREAFDALTVPLDIVAANEGLAAENLEALRRLVAGRTDRTFTVVGSTHDIAATHPGVVVDLVRARLHP